MAMGRWTLVAAAAALLPVTPAGAQQAGAERRGLLGVGLSCQDCVVLRGPGRVAYSRYPAFTSVTRTGPAGSAGIQRGDTLISVDGMDVTTPEGLERLAYMRPGMPVRIGVRRAGQSREVTVVPSQGSETGQAYYQGRLRTAQRLGAEALRSSFRSPLGWLGMGLECENCSVTSFGRTQQVWRFRQAPAVLTVDVDGPAHRGGVRRGDTITAIDGVDLTTTEGGRAFAQIEPGQRVTLTLRRDGRERRLTLAAVPRPDATREEITAFEEYRRMRDSSQTVYRQALSATTQRAQAEIAQLERLLRDADARTATAEIRGRMSALDSMMRALRELERQRTRSGAFVLPEYVEVIRTQQAEVAVQAARLARVQAGVALELRVLPVRFSGTLAGLVNIEARAIGPVNVQEMGDSVIVLLLPGNAEVRVVRRAAPRR